MQAHWGAVGDGRVLLTGGTGFLGRWLVESFVAAARAGPVPTLYVLARDPQRFLAEHPHLIEAPRVELVHGDVSHLTSVAVDADVVVHGAAPRRERLLTDDADSIEREIGSGAAAVADYARTHGVAKLLFLSSGAAADPAPGYAAGKRAAETEFRRLSESGTDVVIARCYSVLGPGMHQSFAAARFMKAAAAGDPIELSDPEVQRSYLYAGDAAAWLWRLSMAPGGLYPVGSDEAVTLGDLAEIVRDVAGGLGCATPPVVPSRSAPHRGLAPSSYVPDLAPVKPLGLAVWTSLRDAVRATLRWAMDA